MRSKIPGIQTMEKQAMKSLSVIIPTRDRPALLKRALGSIAAQWRDDMEVIVVDDASAMSCDLSGLFPPNGLRTIRNGRPLGAAMARNAGIEVAQGRWVVFLDDDDDWEQEFVQTVLARLNGLENERAFCWCSIKNIDYDANERPIGERPRLFKAVYPSQQHLSADAATIGASWGFTVNQSCFKDLGGFDSSYHLIEDTELIFRFLAADCVPVAIAEPLVRIHNHGGPNRLSSTARYPERIAECRRLLEQYAGFLKRHPIIADGLRAHILNLEAAIVDRPELSARV